MAPSRGAQKAKKAQGKANPHKSLDNTRSGAADDEQNTTVTLPVAVQQKLLNLFRGAFSTALDSDYEPTLQEVKRHLYNRDFAQAFSKEEYLNVYALRWSSSRALCYAGIFTEVLQAAQEQTGSGILTVACLGGGAGAELVGLAGALKGLTERSQSTAPVDDAPLGLHLDVRAVDIADWTGTISALRAALTTAPAISAYASAAAKAANCPLVEESSFGASFTQADLHSLGDERMAELVGSAQLITLMFTLNELYSASLSATQAMLEAVGAATQPGTLLLVVDSPGSYSTVTLNGKEKQYPMHWLLDYTLVKQPVSKDGTESTSAKWQKLRTEESTWYRLPEGLKYPIQLENMRFQLHLYRRT